MTLKGPRLPVAFETTENIQFNSCDWFETDYSHDFMDDDRKKQYYDRQHNKEYTVFSFGVRIDPANQAAGQSVCENTVRGQSVCVRVRNYFPYFYVLIPKEFDEGQVRDMLYAFSAYNTEDVETNQPSDEQKFYSPYMKSGINQSRVEVVEREIFWKFMNNAKFRFLKLVFRSRAAMMFYYRYLLSPVDLRVKGTGEFKYNMFEADLEPCLRFFHDAEIKPSGWVELKPGTYRKAVGQSKCQINIETSFENFRPVAIDSIAPFRVASFDIEADSSHGDFPVPRKDCKKLSNQLAICWLRDSFIIEKEPVGSAKRGQATLRQAQGAKFFELRIKQALGIIQTVDDEIDKIYLKTAHTELYLSSMEAKCNNANFKTLCQDIHEICRRPLRKVKADTRMKAAAKQVENKESEYIDRAGFIEFPAYIQICLQVGKSFKLDNPEDLVDKMYTKETIVRFINQKLNAYLGRALGDPVIQIGTVFWEYGDQDIFHNNIITLKNASPFDVGDRACEVISFDYHRQAESENAEALLLLEWTKLIERYDPDIIIGYNIHGFDMTYMYDRALEVIAKWSRGGVPTREDIRDLEKHEKFMRFLALGRLAPDTVARCDNAKGGLTNKKLSSSALGDNFLFYFNTPGRVQIDLLKVCQSSLAKLPSYKLDDVASFFISGDIKAFKSCERDGKAGASAEQAHKMKVTNLKEIDIGNYVVINMATTGQQLYDGDKIRVLDVDRDAETITLERPVPTNSLKNLPQWGLAKDDVSAKDIFRMQKGTDDDRMTIAKYCIQDCALLIRLLKKLEVITNNVGMSNVCLIPFSYIFLRGQGIKIFSLVVKECSLAGYVLPTLEKVETDEEDLGEHARPNPNTGAGGRGGDEDGDDTGSSGREGGGGAPIGSGDDDEGDVFKLKSDFNVIKITDEGYEGAIVLPPKPGIYTDPITVLDFASLYPSEMIASDLSHDRFIEDACWLGDDGKRRLEELGYEVLDRSYDNLVWVDPRNKGKGKRPEGKTHVRFVHPKSGEKGLIPKIEMKLLAARKAAKKLMEAEENPFKKSLYEGLQLAYKLVANSLYGQIGAQTSKIYKKEIAASTTAGGRANILRGRDFCLKNNPGCEVVYGDTDSLFMKLNLAYEDGTYPETDEEQIARSIEIGKWLQQKMKDEKVFKKPHDLEYEKVFKPLILASKKRYIGIKYEEDPKKGKKTSMGVVTKRRDNAPILKHTFNGVVDILTQEGDTAKAVRFVQETGRDMIDGKFDLNMFVISKTLREYYKDPESIAHKVLAMRMADRDPGNKPASNERIPYVYIKIDEKPGVEYLQGDRIEHINYVREHRCKVDFEVILRNQIMKPVGQILELDLENIPGYPYKNDPAHYINLENHYYNKFEGDLKKTAKKVSALRQELVHKLVFLPLIDYCQQKHSGVRSLESWLSTVPFSEKAVPRDWATNNSPVSTVPFSEKAVPRDWTIISSPVSTVPCPGVSVVTGTDKSAAESIDNTPVPKKSQRGKAPVEASVKKYRQNTLDSFLV